MTFNEDLNREGAALRLLLCFWCGQEDMKSLRFASGARCTNRVENEKHACILQRFCITPYSYQKTKKEPLYDSFSVFGAGKRT
jgi:hypothetical protein